jgi:4'-phosphopantetheinyl transferase superfamily
MSLASILLQRYYIFLSRDIRWDDIEISRTEYGKPYYKDLEFNVSHTDGIVVLVGYSHPIGVDIVRRDRVSTGFGMLILDLTSAYSDREYRSLIRRITPFEFNDAYMIDWAFKEAYMKFTGIPDWDHVQDIEFPGVLRPQRAGTILVNPTPQIYIYGETTSAHTEVHSHTAPRPNYPYKENTHFIAIYTSHAPKDEVTQFVEISLEEITNRFVY